MQIIAARPVGSGSAGFEPPTGSAESPSTVDSRHRWPSWLQSGVDLELKAALRSLGALGFEMATALAPCLALAELVS